MSGNTILQYLNTLGFSHTSIFNYGDQQTEAASIAAGLQETYETY